MSKGARFALALVLFWLAFACFYVAFHPGGLVAPGNNPDTGQPDAGLQNGHRVRNPSEVVSSLILKISGTGLG